MKIKIYKILKLYPSLPNYFEVGDYIYYQEEILGEDKYSYKTNVGWEIDNAARLCIYRKVLHQPKDPYIFADEVEKNPEYFEEIESLQIVPEIHTIIIEDPDSILAKKDVELIIRNVEIKNGEIIIKIIKSLFTNFIR